MDSLGWLGNLRRVFGYLFGLSILVLELERLAAISLYNAMFYHCGLLNDLSIKLIIELMLRLHSADESDPRSSG